MNADSTTTDSAGQYPDPTAIAGLSLTNRSNSDDEDSKSRTSDLTEDTQAIITRG